jgi:hypothetical protein
MYDAWLKAHRLAYHRADVRDKATIRLADAKIQTKKALASEEAAQKDLELRVINCETADEDEAKWATLLEERRTEHEDHDGGGGDGMWVDSPAAAPRPALSDECFNRYKDTEDTELRKLVHMSKRARAAEPKSEWSASQDFRAGRAATQTQADTDADKASMAASAADAAAAMEAIQEANALTDPEARQTAIDKALARFVPQATLVQGKGCGKAAAVGRANDAPYVSA